MLVRRLVDEAAMTFPGIFTVCFREHRVPAEIIVIALQLIEQIHVEKFTPRTRAVPEADLALALTGL